MNVSLVLVGTDGTQKEVPLKKSVSVLGRQEGCDLRVPHADVSRRHCEVRIEGDEVTIKDLRSANGTRVNGKGVGEADLDAGDVLALGPVVLVLRIEGKPESIDSTAALRAAKGARKTPGPAAKKPSAPVPAPKAGDDEEDLLGSLATQDPDASSVIDFDFSDEDDDVGRQPRL